MMTREQKLWSMTGRDLIEVAKKLGVKLSINKTGTGLKESKEKAIQKILAAEATKKTEEQPAEVVETVEVVEAAEVEEPVVDAEPKKEKKARRKKTFEELVAEIPAPGNIRFVKAVNGDVLVKRGNKRIFRYNGHTLTATTEKMFFGCDYEKQNWNGYVIHNATAEIMKMVFKNV